ncbi:MAG: hypothetical protein ACI9OJ_001271 [Myxococcota bacterium]|jgi:hypothetical protein
MTRIIIIGLIAATLLVFGGCKEDPAEAYNRLVFHAKVGNEKAFLDGFTPKSQRMIRALLALRRSYGDLVNADADPYRSLVLETIESVEIDEMEVQAEGSLEKVERRVATITVTDGEILRKIRMVELDDGWKIDAIDLQEFWAEDRDNFKKGI